jgi:PIN domain nuclease of toxin-antitoxin system
MLTDPARLGSLRPLLEDEANASLFSAASSWEIAIKHALGRLPLPEPPADAALGAYEVRTLTP